MSLPKPAAEYELVRLLKTGDEQAFKQLYQLYSARLYGNLLKLVKNDDIARELLQDVFIKVWNHRLNIDPAKSFRSYCFRIAENMVVDFFRKAARDRKLMAYLMTLATEENHSIDHIIDYKECNVLLHRAIQLLPERRRHIFTLCKMEGKSYDEVSRLLGISTATISDHMVKASRSIREYFLHAGETVLLLILLDVFRSGC